MSNAPETLVFRADADREIGTGHLMRCLALAQAWQVRGGRAVFLTRPLPEPLRRRLADEGTSHQVLDAAAHPVVDAATVARTAGVEQAEWVVIDGYHFDYAYQKRLKESVPRVLAFDDDGRAGSYAVDLVLNQNAHADERLYANRAAHTEMLLGPEYVVLRREFLERDRSPRDFNGPARRVVVTLGGADQHNHSLSVLRALNSLSRPLEIVLLLGGGNPHRAVIEAELARLANLSVRVEVNTPHVPDWLSWAGVAITAGGSTVWECAYLGTPAMIGATSAVESAALAGLESCGLFDVLGRYADLSERSFTERFGRLLDDPIRRRSLSERGVRRIDGHGVERVIDRMGLVETACGSSEETRCH